MIELETIARGSDSRIVEPMRRIVRSLDEWRAVWALHAGPEAAAPDVDFTRRVVAAAFAGEKPSAAFAVEIAAHDKGDGDVLLVVREDAPRGIVAAQILSSPYHIVSFDRTDGDVRWAESPSPASARGLQDGPRASHAIESSTGLAPRTAAMLAYLAGPFSGGLILLAESRNADVQFHAWQSIFALGGLALAAALAYAAAVASLVVAATALSTIVRIATGIWIALLVVWAFCLWKAFAGGRWKLPLAGDWAERMLTRRIS
jgi:uncharacterized membrane protein